MASLIKELAYIVIDEGDVEAWSGFGTQLLGFEVQRHRPVLTMKMDPSPPRYFVLERKSNSSFPTLGWLTADAETLDVIGARLRDLAISSRSEEHTSELQSLMRISYAVFCLKNKNLKKRSTQKCNTKIIDNKQ